MTPIPNNVAALAEEVDVADIIAGALQTSRAHAYELMCSALASQSEEQGKDAGRLDFMDRQPFAVYPESYGFLESNASRRWMWFVKDGSCPGAATLREAIDAAMATPKEGA